MNFFIFFTIKTDYKISFSDVFSAAGKTITTKAILFNFLFFKKKEDRDVHGVIVMFVQYREKGKFASVV